MQDLRVCICVWHGSVRGKLDNVHKQVVIALVQGSRTSYTVSCVYLVT
jgi:hypothetical protein